MRNICAYIDEQSQVQYEDDKIKAKGARTRASGKMWAKRLPPLIARMCLLTIMVLLLKDVERSNTAYFAY